MVWTSEQKQAIELGDESLLVAAGAGSGKTAVLVEAHRGTHLRKRRDIDSLLVVTLPRRRPQCGADRRPDHRTAEQAPSDETSSDRWPC